ncbi:MAG: hypothetical protein HWE11_15095 [Gammaproteobacteria bacterium]|nr:hypothetical protein [Gammaproteobacteria bacterium]
MSVLAGIDIYFKSELEPIILIELLVKNGWTYDDNGQIVYLPINDNDMFEWQTKNLSDWNSVKEIIREKSTLKELIGLSLTWGSTQVGGEFLFDPKDNSLGIGLNCNRKTKVGTNETDFDWYLEKLINPLEKEGFDIIKYEVSQD